MMRKILLLLLAWVGVGAFAKTPAKHPVKAWLISDVEQAVPGEKFFLGLYLEIAPKWHVYWKNPGDSGTAPKITWTQKPARLDVSPIQWPVPHRIDVPPLTNFGYENRALLFLPAVFAADTTAGKHRLIAKAEWLVCEEICIPGEASLSLEIASGPRRIASNKENYFKTLNFFPTSALPVHATTSGDRVLVSGTTPLAAIDGVDFFPATAGKFAHPVKPEVRKLSDSAFEILLTPDSTLSTPPASLEGLLIFSGKGIPFAYEVSTDIQGGSMHFSELLKMALFALLGGLILNLMPCVFPVLSIKILSFVEQAGNSRKKLVAHGWAFTAGVMISFWILTAALLILRASGQKLGWGFQLQSPLFLFALTALLFCMALNLLGVFEIGSRLMGVGGELTAKGGYAGSFFTGILATIVATPCTAPFMGAAVGFALSEPAYVAFAIFTALGFGMALPYLLLTASPKLMALLPRPGRWMETLKQAMAFPLFATVAWLIWVFGLQTGMDGVLRLLFSLLFFAIAGWTWGRWNHKSAFQAASRLVVLLTLGGAFYFGWLSSQFRATRAVAESTYPITWVDYSEAKMKELRQSGKSIFVDFTAAWCVSCQVNEKLVFGSVEVRRKFHELGVIAVKADWTNENEEIAEALKRFRRSGIPFYLLYGADGKSEPQILPEVLTPAIMLAALSNL